MSEIIRILPDHIANQIAAGEVIQRPASVIKELVENAIDAGASKIDVFIKDAGKTLIHVVDNGIGMSEIDARVCFDRHATSKLKSAEDLFALQTKGFRGEALASIAAIAHVDMVTRQDSSDVATKIVIEGSKVVEQTVVSAPIGTSFSIKNLFFNVPARRNFLKSEAVEFAHIEDEFLRIVLAHPSVHFTLTHNDVNKYTLPASNLRKRIVDVFGRNYNDRLVPIEVVTGIITVVGFIGKPEFARKSRGEQYLFVNNRFFKDTYFNHAIVSAYDNLMASKAFPSYFLYFEIDPATIDVNVHPTKTEIKFEHDKEIYAILKSGTKQGLGKFNIVPTLDFEQETSFDLPWDMMNKPAVEPSIRVNPNYNPFQSAPPKSAIKSSGASPALQNLGFGAPKVDPASWENFYDVEEDEEQEQEVQQSKLLEVEEVEEVSKRSKFLVHGQILYSTVKSGLMAIHTVAAQERIIYDEIMSSFILQPIESQQILFPIDYALSRADIELWGSYQKTLNQLGFFWEVSDTGISMYGFPNYFQETELLSAVSLIDQQVKDDQIDKGEMAHNFILSMSSVAARGKRDWDEEACSNLLERLFQCPEHQYAPSGAKILASVNAQDLF